MDLNRNQNIVVVVLICVTILLLSAMYFRLDLSWVPGLLSRLIPAGNQ